MATDYSLVSVSFRRPTPLISAVWDGILCQFFGFLIVGIIMAINGRAGSVYHVSEAVQALLIPDILSRSHSIQFRYIWSLLARRHARSLCMRMERGQQRYWGPVCVYNASRHIPFHCLDSQQDARLIRYRFRQHDLLFHLLGHDGCSTCCPRP